MRIEKLRVSASIIDAEIRLGFFKTKKISVPTRKMMYFLSDPKDWNSLSEKVLEGDMFHDLAKAIYEINRHDTKSLSEVLLKIAGKHPNEFENEIVKQMLANVN